VSTERALIEQMLAGEERAFNAFFEEYFARLYRFALPRLGGDPEAAEEVVQSTLHKAIRALESFRGESALFTWLCQICRRQIVDYLRAHSRHSDNVVLIEDRPELKAAVEAIESSSQTDGARAYGHEETRRLVQVILDRLPANYANALEWKYVEDRSVEEVSERLGIGVTAAQSLLARARVAFRDALEQVFGAAARDIATGFDG